MPKMKTRKSVAKRFDITGSGKVKYKKQGLKHILTKKTSKRKRTLRRPGILSKADTGRIKEMMPYN